jgi:hypothetical protein
MGVFAHEFGFDSLQDFLDAGLNHHHYPSPDRALPGKRGYLMIYDSEFMNAFDLDRDEWVSFLISSLRDKHLPVHTYLYDYGGADQGYDDTYMLEDWLFAEINSVYFVKMALERGADMSMTRHHDGASILQAMAMLGDDDPEWEVKLDLLIKAGININQKNRHGHSVLEAVLFAEMPIIYKPLLMRLFSAGLALPESTEDRANVLYAAIDCGNPWLVDEILARIPPHQRETVVQHRNADGETALNCWDMYDVPADSDTNMLECLKRAYRAGAKINDVNQSGKTILHIATKFNQVEIIRWALANGVQINIQDAKGHTALSYAESIDVYAMLLNAGSDPFLFDHQGFSVFGKTIAWYNNEYIAVLKQAISTIGYPATVVPAVMPDATFTYHGEPWSWAAIVDIMLIDDVATLGQDNGTRVTAPDGKDYSRTDMAQLLGIPLNSDFNTSFLN